MKRIASLLGAFGVVLFMLAPATARAQTEGGDCTPPSAQVPVVTAGNAFDHKCYAAPAGAFTITLTNNDPFAHNLSIYQTQGGAALFTGDYVPRQTVAAYAVPPIPAGAYYYQCDIHPFMNGKFAIGVDPSTPLATTARSSRAPRGLDVTLQKVADGFVAPVFITGARDGSDRLFIVDQAGQIYVMANGKRVKTPFLDIKERLVPQNPDYDERGLLGLAFHPDYKENGRFFVWYNAPLRPGAPAGWNNTIHLSEFHADPKSNRADPGSERILMAIDHPQANHNSGHIAFGPDGYLYAPLGDGGNANDVGLGHTVPQGNAQDLTNILGDVLRIDVDRKSPGKEYGIPRDNPYADGANGAQPEIYANGFRNPYHISFDAGGDHHLYAADAGQDRFEEISDVRRGANYGWHIREGKHCFDPANPANPPGTCPSTGVNDTKLVDPVLEYNHTEILGSVVIGGYVYRGKTLPQLEGSYVFGDYSRDRLKPDGEIFQAATTGDDAWKLKEVYVHLPGDDDRGPSFGHFVLSFGQDDDNELYVGLATFGGPKGAAAAVYRFAAAQETDANAMTRLARGEPRGAGFWFPLVFGAAAAALGIAVVLRSASVRRQ